MDSQEKLQKAMDRISMDQKEMAVNHERLLKDKEDQLQQTRDEIEKMRMAADQRNKEHTDEISKIRTQNEETVKQMEEHRKKLEMDSNNFREGLVDNAANLVAYMNEYYEELTEEQEQKLREAQRAVRAQHLQSGTTGDPPPYSPLGSSQHSPLGQGSPGSARSVYGGSSGGSVYGSGAGQSPQFQQPPGLVVPPSQYPSYMMPSPPPPPSQTVIYAPPPQQQKNGMDENVAMGIGTGAGLIAGTVAAGAFCVVM